MSLFDAIDRADLEGARRAILAGADLEELDESTGMTPLALAAEGGHAEIAKLLLRVGADPDRGGATTPLETAVVEGHREVVAVLLAAGASVNRAVEDGFTPLMTAASTGQRGIVRLLLGAGAVPHLVNAEGDSAMALAKRGGHEEVMAVLKAVLSQEQPDETLFTSIARRDLTMVKRFLRAGFDATSPDASGWTPLGRATQQGSADLVMALLDAGVEVEEGGLDRPLGIAAAAGFEEVVGVLLEAGATPDLPPGEEPSTPLVRAAAGGHVGVLEMLLDAGASPARTDAEGRTALQRAAAAGRTSAFALLAAKASRAAVAAARAELEAELAGRRRAANETAYLISKVAAGQVDEVKRRVADQSLDLDGVDEDGNTLLVAAAQRGDLELISQLIRAGADVNACDRGAAGKTALIQAIRSRENPRRAETIDLLIRAGADVNVPCARGWTPLMYAVTADAEWEPDGHGPVPFATTTAELIRLGAVLEASDAEGNSAWTLAKKNALGARTSSARRRRLHHIIRILENAGAPRPATFGVFPGEFDLRGMPELVERTA